MRPAKQWGLTRGEWPKKGAKFLLCVLKNTESNAEVKGLDVDFLVIEHIQANEAPQRQRGPYGAHGRALPATPDGPTEKEQLVPEPEGSLHGRKRYPRRN